MIRIGNHLFYAVLVLLLIFSKSKDLKNVLSYFSGEIIPYAEKGVN